MSVPLWVWIATIVGIAIIFTVSLIFGRKAHVISVAEAGKWVGFYVALAVVFGIGVWVFAGGQFAGEFFAGYATEYALSIDNLFVFVILLTAFRVPRELQGRVVLIGIMIALVLRGGLIAVGAALVSTFSWVFYIFGAFLVFTAWRLAKEQHDDEHMHEPKTVALLRRVMPITPEFHGTKLAIREAGKRVFTPLAAVILALGVTDLVFALDSIPAIFGLTKEPFLVFTANAFALLGLSELYFLLGALLQRLIYLSKGLALILAFIGVKLILEALADNNLPFINGGEPIAWAPHISPALSLAVVGSILATTVILSLVVSKHRAGQEPEWAKHMNEDPAAPATQNSTVDRGAPVDGSAGGTSPVSGSSPLPGSTPDPAESGPPRIG